jgi:hypothetical protein
MAEAQSGGTQGVPEVNVPAATVPAATVPAATVPAATVPAATVPAATVPAATVPAARNGHEREPRAAIARAFARRRAAIALAFVIGLTLLWLGFGVKVYVLHADIDLFVVAAALVACFAAVDLWIRPHTDAQGATAVRSFMPFWAVLPFLLALMTSAWVHYLQWQRGLDDIAELAVEIDGTTALRPGGQITSKAVEDTAREVASRHFPLRSHAYRTPAQDPAPGAAAQQPAPTVTPGAALDPAVRDEADLGDRDQRTDERRRFVELVRVIAHDLARLSAARDATAAHPADAHAAIEPCPGSEGGPAARLPRPTLAQELKCSASRDARFHLYLAFCVQSLFVLWIPFLLVISIGRATRRLKSCKRTAPSDAPAQPAAVHTDHALHCALDERDRRILGEDHAYFMPRLCFAALLILGTTYVFAPFGLRTSYIMSLVEAHALPGHTSFVLWCNHFASAPVITAGFVGFLIYALITATQRFMQDDLDDVAMFSLLVRGLVVILLSLALSSAPFGDIPARLFVFIAGVFPVRALEAIAKRANVTLDPEFVSDDTRMFVGLACLDPAKVFALRAAGIQSTYDLAAMPLHEICSRVRIDPRLLGRAVDRAILIDALGPELACQLEPHAITSATELVAAAAAGLPAAMTEKLGDAPQRAADRLAGDPRIQKLQRWLAAPS